MTSGRDSAQIAACALAEVFRRLGDQLTPTKQGSFSVTIDSLGTGSNGPNGGVAYADPHGSATAVLPALQDTGATGTANLHAKF